MCLCGEEKNTILPFLKKKTQPKSNLLFMIYRAADATFKIDFTIL
jgi:hypothetical protein